ncbi:Surface layer protein [Sarcoptes scabiei]|uniref:U6 snRNA-associated Sm-like protein LSm8 n=1 Tax=Sarcoptes scabiei TaxID=52283 RepID=A0A132A972_SARSC|nr:Lsm1-like protein [Sarcoptes scabiei]UXI16234.1 Surface layer protein [Sarcoptes scabiei]
MAAANLESYIAKTVSVITVDGRQIIGTLKGFDQTMNLIMEECHERVYSVSEGVEQVLLGLYIIRGDNVAVVGEIDEDLDKKVNYSIIRAQPLNPVVY